MADDLGAEIAAMVASGELSPEEAVLQAEALVAEREELEKKAREDQRQRVAALGHRLSTLAQEQVRLRQTTEERWYKDVRQYNGQYDPGEFSDDEGYGSRVFVPLTRRLVNLIKARLYDILFPSDERFYAMEPTPVPDIEEAMGLAKNMPPHQLVQMPDGVSVPAGSLQQTFTAEMEEAKKRADGMQREIDDQLAECRYPVEARNAIGDAVLLGTGVLKGPVVMIRTTKRWVQRDGAFTLVQESRPVPVTVRVDLWNFFPDMSATTVQEAEFVFERHFLTKKQVSELKQMPEVDEDALREILGAEPTVQSSNHRERLRAINGATGAKDRRYEVWEYHGPLTAQDLIDCGVEVDDDPLLQYTGIVWFCNGVVLKAALNPLDSGELPYRVFTWQKDESNIFGFGAPYEVRDNQTSANSSFRAMLDNMGLTVGPQVVVDDSAIEPTDGDWSIAPRKTWRKKTPGDVRGAMQFLEINARFPELMGVFNLSKQLIEEIGTLPAFLQGQDAPSYLQSATGASMAYTAANLWVRRCVRDWDDDIITPMVSGYFDWNMQYSAKEEIKGDSRARALGIAALVELEGQAQRMSEFMKTAAAMGLPMSNQLSVLREYARSFKLDPDRVLPTEEEIEAMKRTEQENGGAGNNPENLKLQVAQENNQLDAKASAELIAFRREELAFKQKDAAQRMQLALATIASNERISVEDARQKYGFEAAKTQAELTDRAEERAHKSRMFNAESQLRVATGAGI